MANQRGMISDSVEMIRKFVIEAYDDGLSIIQELVQNANDAGAKDMKVCYLRDGIKGARHPLLRNPVVLVMNDGDFTLENEDALQRIGMGTKDSSSSTIGHFGLGMKSIFHWCDMYFYFTSKGEFKGTINPFFDIKTERDEIHPDWNYSGDGDFESDFKLLEDAAKSYISGILKRNYFCIAIPLRLESDDSVDIIDHSFFGKKTFREILQGKSQIPLKQVLTVMLATLNSTSKTKSLKEMSILSDDMSLVCSITGKDSVKIKEGDSEEQISYVSSVPARILPDTRDVLEKLQNSSSWKKVYKNGEVVPPEELYDVSDCSVIIVKSKPGAVADLNISYASYLPLKNEMQMYDRKLYGSDFSYSIIFNAPFVIDSGRNGIEYYTSIFKEIRKGINGDVPYDRDAIEERINDISDSADANRFWNLIIMRDVLFPSLPGALMASDKYIANKDKEAIFNALMQNYDEDMATIKAGATRREYIAKSYGNSNRIAYVLCDNHDVIYLPEPKGDVLRGSEGVYNFLVRIANGRQIVFCDDKGNLCGYASKNNLEENLAFADFLELLCTLRDCVSLFDLSTFSGYLENLAEVSYRKIQYGDDAGIIADTCISVIRIWLRKLVDRLGISALPTSISIVLKAFASHIPSDIKLYFRFINISDEQFFRNHWDNGDTAIILYPKARTAKDLGNFGSEIIDDEDYLQNEVKALMNTVDGLEHQGDIFEACVKNCYTKSIASTSMQLLLKKIFDTERVIPATRYSASGTWRETAYISYGMTMDAYCEVDIKAQRMLADFYSFSPEADSAYMLDATARNSFGISEANLRTFDFVDFVAQHIILSSLVYDAAEKVLGNVITLSSRAKFAEYQIFPTIDGRFSRMSDEDTYILGELDISRSILSSLSNCNLVWIENPQIRANLLSAYANRKLNKARFLRLYLTSDSNVAVDKNIVMNFEGVWRDVENLLKDRDWFLPEGGSRRYSGSHIIYRRNLPVSVVQTLGPDFLFITDEDIKSDPCLALMVERKVICGDIKNINPGFIIDAYGKTLPLFRYSVNDNGASKTSSLHYEDIIYAYEGLPEDDPLRLWGDFLGVYCYGYSSLDDRREAYIRAHEYIADYSKVMHKVEDSYYIILDRLAKRKEAFLFVVNLFCDSKLAFDPSRLEKVKFPTRLRTDYWRPLSELFDYSKYPTLLDDDVLSTDIPLSLFMEPSELEKLPGPDNVQGMLFIDFMSNFKGINQSLLSELLFISNDEDSRKQVMARAAGGQKFEYFYEVFKDKYHNGGSMGFFSHPAKEVFNLDEKVNFTRPQVMFRMENSHVACYGHTLTGASRSLSFNNFMQSSQLFSRLNNLGHGKWICYLNPCKDKINEQFVELCNEVMHTVFHQDEDFRPEFRNLITVGEDIAVNITQDRIIRKIDGILSSLRTSTDDQYGKTVENFKAALGNLDRDLAFRRSSYNTQPNAKLAQLIQDIENSIFEQKKEVVKLLDSDEGFRNYILDSFCRSIKEVAYDDKSVPYEFFQNADDAALQLKNCNKETHQSFFFKIDVKNDALVMEHNGRLVNYTPDEKSHNEWRDDLTNMLTFSSGKQHNKDINETGKFGYGFKSCYFLSSEPEIHSGSLNVRIIGGIYPVRCDQIENLDPNVTRFILPVRKEKRNIISSEIIADFEKSAPLLLLFSKAMDSITVNGKTYRKSVVATAGAYSVIDVIDRYLTVSLSDNRGMLAFPINRETQEFASVPESTRKVWCTTPIEMKGEVGYYVNSSHFRIDLGRNQLALDREANNNLLDDFSDAMGRLYNDVFTGSLPEEVNAYVKTGAKSAGRLVDITSAGENSPVFGHIFRKAYTELTSGISMFYTGYEWKTINAGSKYIIVETALGAKDVKKKELQKLGYDFLDIQCHDGRQICLLDRKSLLPSNDVDNINISVFRQFIEEVANVNRELSPEAARILTDLSDKYGNGKMGFELFSYRTADGCYLDSYKLVWKDDDFYGLAPDSISADAEYELSFTNNISKEVKLNSIMEARSDADRCLAIEYLADNLGDFVSYKDELLGADWIRVSWKNYAKNVPDYSKASLVSFFSQVVVEEKGYIEKVYAKWKSLKASERKKFISKFRQDQFGKDSLELSSDSDDWYRLLYLTGLGSMGLVTTSANISFVRNFMSQIDDKSYPLNYKIPPVDQFSEEPCGMESTWMKYMVLSPVAAVRALAGTDGQYEEWRKYLPLFAQLSFSAEILYGLMTTLADTNYYDRLDYSHNQIFEGTGLKGPDLRHALGKYYPILLRELLSNESGKSLSGAVRDRMLQESFYPTRKIRESLGIENRAYYSATEFYEKCKEFVSSHTEYLGLLADSSYPFYYYEGYADMFEE